MPTSHWGLFLSWLPLFRSIFYQYLVGKHGGTNAKDPMQNWQVAGSLDWTWPPLDTPNTNTWTGNFSAWMNWHHCFYLRISHTHTKTISLQIRVGGLSMMCTLHGFWHLFAVSMTRPTVCKKSRCKTEKKSKQNNLSHASFFQRNLVDRLHWTHWTQCPENTHYQMGTEYPKQTAKCNPPKHFAAFLQTVLWMDF